MLSFSRIIKLKKKKAKCLNSNRNNVLHLSLTYYFEPKVGYVWVVDSRKSLNWTEKFKNNQNSWIFVN